MSDFLTERAIKRAYFSDLDGGVILEFQFTPADMDFTEGGQFIERIKTGSYFSDFMWVSGKSAPTQLAFFVDRTQASYVSGTMNQNPFSEVQRFPNRFTKYTNLDIVGLIKNLPSQYKSYVGNKSKEKGTLVASNYSASPHYNQGLDENVGVLKDLEALMYFVRPKGLKLAEITINTSDAGEKTVSMKDYQQSRFTPPPMVRFYFGPIWREGYITEVRYNLSVLNKLLVPQRMDASITMLCTRWGYLNEVGSRVIAMDIDANIKGYAEQ